MNTTFSLSRNSLVWRIIKHVLLKTRIGEPIRKSLNHISLDSIATCDEVHFIEQPKTVYYVAFPNEAERICKKDVIPTLDGNDCWLFGDLKDIPLYFSVTHSDADGLVVLKVKPKHWEPHKWYVETHDVVKKDDMDNSEYEEAHMRQDVFNCPIHHYGKLRIETNPACVETIDIADVYRMDFNYTDYEQKLLWNG